MKDIAKAIVALALFGIGAFVVFVNVKALTLPLLGFAGVLIFLALFLAFTADMEEITKAAAPLLPARWRGDGHQ